MTRPWPPPGGSHRHTTERLFTGGQRSFVIQSTLEAMASGFNMDTLAKWARISVLAIFFVLPMFALPVFFGAWAVSASQDRRVEALTTAPSADNSTQQVVLGVDGVWWQNTLLFVCPLH